MKVFYGLKSVEKNMIRKQLSDYALPNVHLHRYKT